MNDSLSIKQIIAVAEKLKHLKDWVVFVGGATAALLVDEAAASMARQTDDVDFVVDIAVPSDYSKFEKAMRSLGFQHDTSDGAPICRWVMDFMGGQLRVDAMPVESDILGFSNRWYKGAVATAWKKELKPGFAVKVIDPVYFLGTKIEAFKGRGGDSIFSHDLEDAVYVLEHRSDIDRLVYATDEDLKTYLAKAFAHLLQHPDLTNTLPGMVDSQDSVDFVLKKMQFIASLSR